MKIFIENNTESILYSPFCNFKCFSHFVFYGEIKKHVLDGDENYIDRVLKVVYIIRHMKYDYIKKCKTSSTFSFLSFLFSLLIIKESSR